MMDPSAKKPRTRARQRKKDLGPAPGQAPARASSSSSRSRESYVRESSTRARAVQDVAVRSQGRPERGDALGTGARAGQDSTWCSALGNRAGDNRDVAARWAWRRAVRGQPGRGAVMRTATARTAIARGEAEDGCGEEYRSRPHHDRACTTLRVMESKAE